MLSLEDFKTLRNIHARNMKRFQYVTDKSKWGLLEYWEPDQVLFPIGAKFTGDCEEFARVCMHDSMEAGFTARLIVCLTELGEGHCICEVMDSQAQSSVFLDNRQTRPASKNDLAKYMFYSASPWNPKPGDARPWKLIKE